jgi:hypothetical protein
VQEGAALDQEVAGPAQAHGAGKHGLPLHAREGGHVQLPERQPAGGRRRAQDACPKVAAGCVFVSWASTLSVERGTLCQLGEALCQLSKGSVSLTPTAAQRDGLDAVVIN